MALRLLGHIDLPEHRGAGGFDHADVHSSSDRLYVAHTSNDALDVIDIARDQYIESMPGLTAAAGVLVSGVDSSLHPIEAKTLSRCLSRMPSGTLSRFP